MADQNTTYIRDQRLHETTKSGGSTVFILGALAVALLVIIWAVLSGSDEPAATVPAEAPAATAPVETAPEAAPAPVETAPEAAPAEPAAPPAAEPVDPAAPATPPANP